MRRARWGWIAAPLLAVATAVSAAGGVKLSPGQEFLYSGTVEVKISMTGQPASTAVGPVRASALVTEADPARGYTIVGTHQFEPPAKAGLSAEAAVSTQRFRADLKPDPRVPARFSSGPVGNLVTRLSLPLPPRAGLKSGMKWRETEARSTLFPDPVAMAYAVTRSATVGGRRCWKIDKKVGQPLPVKVTLGETSFDLTSFAESLCVDAATGQVVSRQMHAVQRQSFGGQHVTLNYRLSLALRLTRRLSGTELASRVKQAEALDRVQQSLFAFRPGADRKKSVEETVEAVAAFRRDYPDSPYAAALARIEGAAGEMRRGMEAEERLQALKGAAAPKFKLKDLDGKEKTLGEYRGKIILLNFFASW